MPASRSAASSTRNAAPRSRISTASSRRSSTSTGQSPPAGWSPPRAGCWARSSSTNSPCSFATRRSWTCAPVSNHSSKPRRIYDQASPRSFPSGCAERSARLVRPYPLPVANGGTSETVWITVSTSPGTAFDGRAVMVRMTSGSSFGVRSSRSRPLRSEERRVGKECRSRCDWSSDVCSSDLNGQYFAGDRLRRPSGDGADDFRVELRRAVLPEQAVGLLLGVGQLGVAEAGDGWTLQHRAHQLVVFGGELLRRGDGAVAVPLLAGRGRVADPAELGQHHRLVRPQGVRKGDGAVMRLHAAQRPFHRLRGTVTLPQRGAVERVVVDAPDVADDVLPAVVADDGTGGVERVGQVVERAHEGALGRVALKVGHTPAL